MSKTMEKPGQYNKKGSYLSPGRLPFILGGLPRDRRCLRLKMKLKKRLHFKLDLHVELKDLVVHRCTNKESELEVKEPEALMY
jgi:hypothetical protein